MLKSAEEVLWSNKGLKAIAPSQYLIVQMEETEVERPGINKLLILEVILLYFFFPGRKHILTNPVSLS